jgi:hypothetical protein
VSGYQPVDLRPGAAVATTISTGDLALGAVGTVTYRDGDDVWAFGHALEGIGRRSLFLQDAYVYTVIQNPLGIPEFGAITYKLASSDGYVHGALTMDKADAVSGKLGAPPPSIPLTVDAATDGGERLTLNSLLADERSLGLGAGLSFVAPLGLTEALGRLTGDFGPATLRACMRVRAGELRRPMGFCNTYFSVDEAAIDLTAAGDLVDSFDLAPLAVERVAVKVRVRQGVKEDVLVRARAPSRARRGSLIRVRLTVQRRRGARHRITVPVRVPRSLGAGAHRLTLRGEGGGFAGDEFFDELVLLLGDGFGGGGGSEPKSVRDLAARLRELHREQGIVARFDRREPRLAHGSNEVSYEGRVRLRLRVTRR